MSIIGKKPFVNSALESLTSQQLNTVLSLSNNPGEATILSLDGDKNKISSANKGVTYVSFTLNTLLRNIVKGILCYNNTYCVLFAFKDGGDSLDCYQLDVSQESYVEIHENLTVEEFRAVLDDILETKEGGEVTPEKLLSIMEGDTGVSVDMNEDNDKVAVRLDISTGSAGDVLKINSERNDVEWGEAGGLPEATEPNQVIVANGQLEPEWESSVPLADNLSGTYGSVNDEPYSAGPTGGSADISNNGATLQEIKGMSIVWNQLIDADHSHQLNSSHVYIYRGSDYYGQASYTLFQNQGFEVSASSTIKLFDLTLMFGGNDKIPFSLTSTTEYAANGSIPAQVCTPSQAFQRLFANVDLYNAPYDAGTIKNVTATKLTETGQNLFDPDGDGTFQVIAGYRYEIYQSSSNYAYYVNYKSGSSWGEASLTSATREDGKRVLFFSPLNNGLIKPVVNSNSFVYIGFVHSGNYILTTGDGISTTTEDIPEYEKYEYSISGISGLNGIDDICDTKDTTRIGSVDLSTLTWTAGSGTYSATISGIKPSTTHILSTTFIRSNMSVDSSGVITITSSTSPTGTLLYELETPISTGESAFESISLTVNDMGFEYFTQPANTNCPVNQKAFYKVNLKDKLVNLEVPDIKISTSYSSDAQPIGQIILNNIGYKSVPIGSGKGLSIGESSDTSNKQSSIAIGRSANCFNADGNIAIGNNSTNACSSYGGVFIGYGSKGYYGKGNIGIGYVSEVARSVEFATSIGCYSYADVDNSVSFDGKGSNNYNQPRTISLHDTGKIFFRNANIGTTKTTFASYTNGHYLSEYIGLTTLTMTESSSVYTSSKTFTDSTNISALHLVIELNDGTNYYCTYGDMKLYDTTNSRSINTSFFFADSKFDGYIDSTGRIVLDCTTATPFVISSVKYHLYS